jgi:hypothetical protein
VDASKAITGIQSILLYNPFPWPRLANGSKTRIEDLAAAVLMARNNYRDSTPAELYDSTTMPPDLRRAHQALDAAVDRLYRREPFNSDRERVEFLLARYEIDRAPLVLRAQPTKKRRRTRERAPVR